MHVSKFGDSFITSTAWFCLRSHPKREHIAAAHLEKLGNIEVFSPRLRIKKATSRGAVTFVEALFPSYLFARFDPRAALDTVKHSPSVSTVVHFGTQIPIVPEDVIAEIKATLDETDVRDSEEQVEDGEGVTIAEGPFQGLSGKVLRVLTPHKRVEVLLEMLGRATAVVVNPGVLITERFS